MRLTGMIWDLDGTLADTLPVCIAAFRHVFERYAGRRYGDEEIASLFGVSEEGMIRRVLPDRWQEGERAYLAEYARLHDEHTVLFPGIEQTLRALQARGIRLAMVTGKGRASAEISLQHFGLAAMFERVEVGSPDAPIKPRGIRAVLDAWGASPGECAYVGDTQSDMVAAAEVGVIGLGAAWAGTATVRADAAVRPTAVFSQVEELMAWVERQIGSTRSA